MASVREATCALEGSNSGNAAGAASPPEEAVCPFPYIRDATAESICGQSELARAIYTSLRAAGVQWLKFITCDVSSQIRGKALNLLDPSIEKDPLKLLKGVNLVECLNGLVSMYDVIAPGADVSPAGTYQLVGDFSTLTVLPYNPSFAVVYGQQFLCAVDPYHPKARSPAPLCSRSALLNQIALAQKEFGVKIQAGVEVEFVLLDKDTKQPIDKTNFSSARALDNPLASAFLTDLQDALGKQRNVCSPVELAHSEAAPGQFEVAIRYADPIATADSVVCVRETLHALGMKHGVIPCLLPKISDSAAGNGMHMHFSFLEEQFPGVWRNGFVERTNDREISEKGKKFMAGVLEDLRAGLLAITTPSCNSFRRMQQGCWAGAFACWAFEHKEAPLRVCVSQSDGSPEHFEVKSVDATCNPYLALTAIIASGLAGLRDANALSRFPGPVTGSDDLRGLLEAGDPRVQSIPSSFAQALDQFALDREVFGPRLRHNYLCVKRAECAHFSAKNLEEEVEMMAGFY